MRTQKIHGSRFRVEISLGPSSLQGCLKALKNESGPRHLDDANVEHVFVDFFPFLTIDQISLLLYWNLEIHGRDSLDSFSIGL